MVVYALRRIVFAVPLFLIVTALCFFLLHAVPGDPFTTLDPHRTAQDRERLQKLSGLDRPPVEQYVEWLGGFVRGDWGTSWSTQEPVWDMIRARLPATLELAGTSLLLSLAFGVPLGVVSAVRRGGWGARLVDAVSLVGLSLPIFWVCVLTLWVFSLHLGWFPAGGRTPLTGDVGVWDRLRYLALPAGVLAWAQLPLWSRYVRAGVLDALRDSHVRTARAKGLDERVVLRRHVLPTALVPLVTALGLQVPALFTGTVITESVFAWPGIGRLFYSGLQDLDYFRIMGILALSTIFVIVGNLLADLVNASLDPRMRVGARHE